MPSGWLSGIGTLMTTGAPLREVLTVTPLMRGRLSSSLRRAWATKTAPGAAPRRSTATVAGRDDSTWTAKPTEGDGASLEVPAGASGAGAVAGAANPG